MSKSPIPYPLVRAPRAAGRSNRKIMPPSELIRVTGGMCRAHKRVCAPPHSSHSRPSPCPPRGSGPRQDDCPSRQASSSSVRPVKGAHTLYQSDCKRRANTPPIRLRIAERPNSKNLQQHSSKESMIYMVLCVDVGAFVGEEAYHIEITLYGGADQRCCPVLPKKRQDTIIPLCPPPSPLWRKAEETCAVARMDDSDR